MCIRSLAARWILVAALGATTISCVATISRGPVYFDRGRCYWSWVQDGYGGYEQMYCWHPQFTAYMPYLYNGVYVRRYPGWYNGPRVTVRAPPVMIVNPIGVPVMPAPRFAPPTYVPPARGGGPVYVPPRTAPPVYVPPRR